MPGKKAKDQKDWKTRTIRVRVSEQDYQAFAKKANDEGYASISDLIRSLLPRDEEQETETAIVEPNRSATHEITLPGYPGTFTVKE